MTKRLLGNCRTPRLGTFWLRSLGQIFRPYPYGPSGEGDWLKRQGVDVGREDNRALLEAGRKLQSFCSRHVNDVPTESESSAITPDLRHTFTLLESVSSADLQVKTDVLTS